MTTNSNDASERLIDSNENINILRDAVSRVSNGYPRDILNWLISSCIENQKIDDRKQSLKDFDAHIGDMFRCLVLDESWSVDEARNVYSAAMDRLDELWKGLGEIL